MTNYTSTRCAGNAEADAVAAERPIVVEQRCPATFCLDIVLGFLAALLTFTLGLIIGAVAAAAILTAIPALIILAVVLAILIISLLIFKWCRRDKKDHCRCCCR